MEQNPEFATELLRQIIQNSNSFQERNTDYETYPSQVSRMIRVLNGLRSLLHKRGLCLTLELNASKLSDHLAVHPADLEGLEELYDLLENRTSKDLLVYLIAYRLMGRDRVRLPLNTDRFWEKRKSLRSLLDYRNTIKSNFNNFNLAYVDLAPMGYPIKLYHSAPGIHTLFDLKQYEYHQCDPVIKATKGNVVIDAGGGYGDTALYFANEVGPTGHVFTFEFVPANLNIMKRNLDLNPELRGRIDVIERPLWNRSEEMLYFTDNGPGTRVSFERRLAEDEVIPTVTIDDFVELNQPQRIDYIKMDIEGAESNALEGAARSIEAFRPKLAISIYHRLRDFVTIPRLLKSLEPNYRFYLGHYTIHAAETILFAVPRK